jgi:hypothetical protein
LCSENNVEALLGFEHPKGIRSRRETFELESAIVMEEVLINREWNHLQVIIPCNDAQEAIHVYAFVFILDSIRS